MITVGIIEFNTPDLTNIAIKTATENAGIDHELIVVVNSPKTSKKLKVLASQLIINRRNIGFTKAANQIIQYNNENDVVLLNSDTKCQKDWLKHLKNAAYMESNKKIGLSCPRLVEKYSIHKGKFCAHKGSGCSNREEGPWFFIGWHGFACTYLKRDMINDIGLLQERYVNYGSDKEYGLRAAKMGYYTIHTHRSIVHHLVKASQVKYRQW